MPGTYAKTLPSRECVKEARRDKGTGWTDFLSLKSRGKALGRAAGKGSDSAKDQVYIRIKNRKSCLSVSFAISRYVNIFGN